MAKLNRQQIQAKARDLLENAPQGLRWADILRKVHGDDPETPLNSVQGAIVALFNSGDSIDPAWVILN